MPYKLAFYDAFLALCERLRGEGRPVLFCGDVNTAHREIDLARPRENRNTTGFLPEERAWMDTLIAHGYVDSFRHFYPDLEAQYTWWLQFGGARERNIGWRIDYFFAAVELLPACATPSSCPRCAAAITAPSVCGWRWRTRRGVKRELIPPSREFTTPLTRSLRREDRWAGCAGYARAGPAR